MPATKTLLAAGLCLLGFLATRTRQGFGSFRASALVFFQRVDLWMQLVAQVPSVRQPSEYRPCNAGTVFA
jgi:hypothetical protein